MKRILVITAVSLLAGCGGGTNIKAQVAGANVEIARAKAAAFEKPILDAKIPIVGCIGENCVIHIVVRTPQGGGQGDYVPSPDDPWARVAERAVGGLVTAGGIYLGGAAAANIVDTAAHGIVNALKVQPAPTIVTSPAPVVVNQPPPVVVTQPAPVIVDPVIVTQPEPVIVAAPPLALVD